MRELVTESREDCEKIEKMIKKDYLSQNNLLSKTTLKIYQLTHEYLLVGFSDIKSNVEITEKNEVQSRYLLLQETQITMTI